MSSIIQARVGREKQLYDGKFRLVSGCIPYRKIDAEKSCSTEFRDDEYEVLMISTPKRDDLVFPKGGWENDESVREAASREALEEAGVRGVIDETMLGIWEFRSKSKQNSQEGSCRGYMFAMQVTEQLDSWPEQDTHHRRWVKVSEAPELCRYEWMREVLCAFVTRLQSAKCTFAFPPKPSPHFCLVNPSDTERMDNTINAIC